MNYLVANLKGSELEAPGRIFWVELGPAGAWGSKGRVGAQWLSGLTSNKIEGFTCVIQSETSKHGNDTAGSASPRSADDSASIYTEEPMLCCISVHRCSEVLAQLPLKDLDVDLVQVGTHQSRLRSICTHPSCRVLQHRSCRIHLPTPTC